MCVNWSLLVIDHLRYVCVWFCFKGHALRGPWYWHRGDDGQVDSTNGLPCCHHQQEPIRAAPYILHHSQPGALPVWRGSQKKQQVRELKAVRSFNSLLFLRDCNKLYVILLNLLWCTQEWWKLYSNKMAVIIECSQANKLARQNILFC